MPLIVWLLCVMDCLGMQAIAFWLMPWMHPKHKEQFIFYKSLLQLLGCL